MDENTILAGDCVRGMKKLPEGCVDLAFADPPFNIGYEYDVYRDVKSADKYLAWCKQWGEQIVRVLKPTGSFWLAIGDEFAAELKVMFTRELGLHCRSWVVWYYTFGVNCVRKSNRSHAHLFHFVKDADDFTFNADDPAIRVPSARMLVYADPRANPKGRLPDDTWVLRPQDLPDGFGGDGDVWHYPRVCGTFKERAGWHGCQMPEQLLARIIRASSNEGDMVLDPFAGSGSTLVVARKLNRNALGFELSKSYASQANKRLKKTDPGDLLEGVADPNRSVADTANGRRFDPTTQKSTSRVAGAKTGKKLKPGEFRWLEEEKAG